MKKKYPVDYGILLTVLILVSIGVIMVFSASSASAEYMYNDAYYFLKRQLLWVILGFFAMVFMMNFDYTILKKLAGPLLIISIGLLIAVLIPGIGVERYNATRWIGVGSFTIQPSELAKYALIIYLAKYFDKHPDYAKSFKKGVMPVLGLAGLFFGLIMLQPNFSTAGIIFIVAVIILFVAGAKLSFMGALFGAGIGAAIVVFSSFKYIRERVFTFLNPWQDIQKSGYQIVQSLYALGSGGLFGVGLGGSRQKLMYLPMPYNDFIFSIIGEELGLVGTVTILLMFLYLILRGLRVAAKAPDMFGCLLATGITSLIGVQTLINVAVVTSSMPPTGVSLPFISYGGTSTVIMMAGVGILLNISRSANLDRS
ncbi:stage V sporulation protein E [Thermoanaerobacter wiegelii]|uniref:Probable peptidoglycan glycosyltransferase FtsW n=1 Tax=Thermoanaerobacter wiegelii Rt8.B1 TaxID=697303 RepID=G2MTJ4_9THEO|nr:stage V sporulation protein E [Thermoanaerobacter wiegelii]AEM79008.1 stage V sporulation protein E [Thermoanaerobacter wiegelii Rt8.B1]